MECVSEGAQEEVRKMMDNCRCFSGCKMKIIISSDL